VQMSQRERRVQIVFEGLPDRPQSLGSLAKPLENSVTRQGQRTLKAVEGLPRLAQSVARPVERVTIMRR
jgi:hypothetical protein